jgi:hypothetical protein
MPLEPKKPIDELLEASAKARRAAFGADPKMPNPMRAQLHDEIARLARKDECKSRPRSFGISWPQLMTATALALILASASAIWWWREHQSAGGETMKLAMQQPMAPANEAAAPEKVFDQGAAAAATPSGEGVADNKTSGGQSAARPKAADTLSKLAEAAVTPPPVAPPTKDFIGVGKKTDGSLPSDISLAAKESNQSAPAAASLPQNRQTTNFRQQFSKNASDQAFRSKPKQMLNILNEFQVEQTDHEIRVVDADGSAYSGKLEPLGQNDARSIFNKKRDYAAPSPRAPASFDDKAQAANAEFYFRATGYNSSLKKRVVFEGNYIASSAAPQKKAAEAKVEAEERDEQTPARITGTAKIPGESPLQIDAIAVAK